MALVACHYTFGEAFSRGETRLGGYREAHFTSVLGKTFCQLQLSNHRIGCLKISPALCHCRCSWRGAGVGQQSGKQVVRFQYYGEDRVDNRSEVFSFYTG